MLLGSLFSVLLVIGGTYCMSSGPPGNTDIVCNVISPNPTNHGSAATGGNGGYVIATDAILSGSYYEYVSGQTYTVQLLSTDGNPFRGFLVQARNPADGRIGTFVPEDSTQGAVDCSTFGYPAGSSTGHRSVSSRLMRTFSWVAPSDGDGMVDFRYAVVRVRNTYFASLSAAAQMQVPLVAVVTDPPVATVAPTAPPNAVPPTRSPESYRITLRVPSNCAPANCTLFIGMDTNEGNDEYLDVYMEGDTAGWIALGFSETANMFSSDVLACNLNSDNMVEVLDTWNVADPNRGNVRDTVEDVWLFSSIFNNGRLTCCFIRNIVGTDVGVSDLSLDQPYFLMYGMNPTSFAGGLAPHLIGAGNPKLSPSMINPKLSSSTINPVTSTPPPNAVPPTRSPESYRITLRVPSDCAPATCTLFIGVDTNEGNDEYLDVYMEGDTTGWIALGFSETASMFSSDVLACNLNSDNMVEVLDTWNFANPRRGNVRDTVEDVWLFSSNFNNGRLTCSFIRNIVGTDVGVSDLSLDQPYFLMYGMNPTSSAGRLDPHVPGAGNPKLSPSTINPSSDAASSGSRVNCVNNSLLVVVVVGSLLLQCL